MEQLDILFQEWFPEQGPINSKTLRVKRQLREQFDKSIKELRKQGVSTEEAIAFLVDKLGGKDRIKRLIRKATQKRRYLTSPYALITLLLLFVYPLILWIITSLSGIEEELPLYVFSPAIIGFCMLMSKLYVAVFRIQTQEVEIFHELNNASVFAGAGMRYKDQQNHK